jgi:hypothetical protein
MREKTRTDLKVGAKWGIIFGVSICLWTIGVHLLGFYTSRVEYAQSADIAATILPVAALFLAIRERRARNPGGDLTLRDGFLTGTVAGIVSIPISSGFLWVYHHYINANWLTYLVNFEQSEMRKTGASQAAIHSKLEALRASGSDWFQLRGAIIGTILLSMVLSLILASILRRSTRARATS